ncbi:MAG: SRPBCC domain-containing protein [Dehalococcoidia bacterium]
MGLSIGPMHVRRSIFIQAAPAAVWREFESFERIASWLSLGHTLHSLDLQVGGIADFSVEIEGEHRHYGGRVLIFERERELSLESNWAAPHAWPVPTLWTIRLNPLYDGTQVEIFHHGFERLGADAADNLEGYEEGWDVKHLKALRRVVER